MSELLTRTRAVMRLKHYSYKTEKIYVYWMKKYFYFHNLRHPKELGAAEVEKFLTFLAVEQKVSASTQNQALFALLFLYRDVLKIALPRIEGVIRAKRPEHLLENQYCIRTVQELLGYKDVRTTQIYMHVVKHKSIVKSPLDA